MTQPISAIAKSLVRERLRTGLSLAEIARRAGIAKSTLSQLESGNGNPSLETLWSLCVALDIPFARLFEPHQPATQVPRRGAATHVLAGPATYAALLPAACPPGPRPAVFPLPPPQPTKSLTPPLPPVTPTGMPSIAPAPLPLPPPSPSPTFASFTASAPATSGPSSLPRSKLPSPLLLLLR